MSSVVFQLESMQVKLESMHQIYSVLEKFVNIKDDAAEIYSTILTLALRIIMSHISCGL